MEEVVLIDRFVSQIEEHSFESLNQVELSAFSQVVSGKACGVDTNSL